MMKMLSKNTLTQRDQLEMVAIDQLVPQNHLVRKMEAALDFSFIYDEVIDVYSVVGRPSIDPVILVKLTFIQYAFGIRSMRQTIAEVETNLAYRWFLGYGFYNKVPHFSTFGKNYVRRFEDTVLFERIFYRILEEAVEKKLISADHIFIDSTHVKASANKHKFEKKVVQKEARAYQKQLQEEITRNARHTGKNLFQLRSSRKRKQRKLRKAQPIRRAGTMSKMKGQSSSPIPSMPPPIVRGSFSVRLLHLGIHMIV